MTAEPVEELPDLPSREQFVALLWNDLINRPMAEDWIEGTIQTAEKKPNGPFADSGPVLKRLLSLGASKRDLSLLKRMASYEAVFHTLYLLADPGVDPEQAGGLWEDLLTGEPSGLEAGPGSAPRLAD